MNDEQFYNVVIHTDREEVPSLRDQTAGQFLLKMASLKATIQMSFGEDLRLEAQTPLGTYTFILGPNEGDPLTVDQVL